MPAPPLSALAVQLKAQAPELFLPALLFAPPVRERAMALMSLQHELAEIASKVHEPVLGQVRLQWWDESLQAVVQGRPTPAHPVVQALAQLPAPLAVAEWQNALAAREREMLGPELSLAELPAHASALMLPLLRALLELAAAPAPAQLEALAQALGCCEMLATGRLLGLSADEVVQQARVALQSWRSGPRLSAAQNRALLLRVGLTLRLSQPGWQPHPLRALALCWRAVVGGR